MQVILFMEIEHFLIKLQYDMIAFINSALLLKWLELMDYGSNLKFLPLIKFPARTLLIKYLSAGSYLQQCKIISGALQKGKGMAYQVLWYSYLTV